MLMYMSNTNCQYLYLSNSQATKGAGFVTWNNIPSMSQSTRECYITAVRLNIVFTPDPPQTHSDIIVKTPSIATMNYTSTDNSEPLIAVLNSNNSIFFDLPTENPIHLLSNDNIKSFKLNLLQTDETATSTPIACNVLLKFDYVDQLEQTELYISQKPRTLD
jgi:hypothetical protein